MQLEVERLLYLSPTTKLGDEKQRQSCHHEGKNKREIEMKSIDICNNKKKFTMAKRRRHVHNHEKPSLWFE
jgi:hypothetical protein